MKKKNYPNSIYIFIVIFVAFSAVIPNFFTATNLSTLLLQACILMVLSAAMSLAIMTGGIDLSMGGVVSLVGVIIALLITKGVPEWLAIISGICFAVFFGFLNGLIIVKLKVAPFIATFGMMGVAQGLANLFSDSRAIYLSTDVGLSIIPFLQKNILEMPMGLSGVFSLNMIVVLTIIVLALLLIIYNKTVLSSYIYALGGNREAARLSNINVDRWNVIVYMITGLLAGLVSLLMLLRLNSAQPTSGDGLEFQAVVAAVLGGNFLAGGKGSVPGAIIGALAVYCVRNGLTLAGFNTNIVMIVLGLVLVLGMILNDFATKGIHRTVKGGSKIERTN